MRADCTGNALITVTAAKWHSLRSACHMIKLWTRHWAHSSTFSQCCLQHSTNAYIVVLFVIGRCNMKLSIHQIHTTEQISWHFKKRSEENPRIDVWQNVTKKTTRSNRLEAFKCKCASRVRSLSSVCLHVCFGLFSSHFSAAFYQATLTHEHTVSTVPSAKKKRQQQPKQNQRYFSIGAGCIYARFQVCLAKQLTSDNLSV